MAKTKHYTGPEVLEMVGQYMSESDTKNVKKAYEWASELHKEQKRKSGEPYIIHPIQVAGILAELKMDTATVISGYLHDVVEDTTATLQDVRDNFGETIAQIIDGVTKISKIQYQSSQEQLAENHRKLLLAMSKDIRVIIVKLADRLHNMRTLGALREEKQKRIAKETLEIYAPLADRLGISTIKWELEDLSLSYIDPEQYYHIASLMNMKREERISYVQEAVDQINGAIKDLELSHVDVYGRPKHIYSIYRKMVDKHKAFEEIYDLLAVRVLTDSIPDTYAVLGAIHSKWTPIPGRFKDYIALPKANGYQSLHTTVIGPDGRPLEVQIRTHHMHEVAEYGVAAHWAYKKNRGSNKEANVDDNSQQALNVIQGILELQENAKNAEDFMDGVTGDLFSDRVYAFTPRGDVFELAKGAGPLDMAFSIHTNIGIKTTGAKINGRIVPLDYKIKTGDIIEIITSANAKPSRDWLEIVSTRRARNKIKQYFKQLDREDNIAAARELLAKNLRDNNFNPAEILTPENIQETADKMHYHTADDMLAAIGFGDIAVPGVANKLTEKIREANEEAATAELQREMLEEGHEITRDETAFTKRQKSTADDIVIAGVDNLLVRLGRCCTPVPGDDVKGYITKGRGISVHRVGCPNIRAAQLQGQRLVDVQWEDENGSKPNYDADLTVHGENRGGLLNDVLRSVNGRTRYVNSVNGHVTKNGMAQVSLSIGVKNSEQLTAIMDSLNNLPAVYDVERTFH
ncbi:MAG: bifunctional (p)ppGpp synthetase/guanosine-3',5'-bis(diphosphate) 3'-pyrophosphohydrolase [Leuconostoc mesenteroides]|jgi:GTP pyrophosphokinase|uniref:RelA/SpoT family protein n=1 Tax=Leuconostoc mesenteroides TaxID=1245 RepID=UPI0003D827C8|nr:bifunctional (p)ppGpp synthetase/guanosine-3',5'-bis(diphosphate) 3'-pyrophosphohydrolase [Leuconostoc mesenteroides]AHF19361.1 Guanosine polyphosphate pyrophosphohydrolase/synthetase [Leuconostoc mesenteroides KFRI-MG]APE76933.1 GTP pyrophosphokinase [Leuconostoc mesenteroides subsp. jonggajibkimchii]ASR69527.1 bifunctional (p)ppGpp synthetase/guanosine-3',5'-bis(diphosphate) 3'-pyrophosphohydrolase [Leuconostoc mesenteroides]AWV38172.1 bifunctional (p)ppGpp synthetase/guanosine-3',5'-bis(d